MTHAVEGSLLYRRSATFQLRVASAEFVSILVGASLAAAFTALPFALLVGSSASGSSNKGKTATVDLKSCPARNI